MKSYLPVLLEVGLSEDEKNLAILQKENIQKEQIPITRFQIGYDVFNRQFKARASLNPNKAMWQIVDRKKLANLLNIIDSRLQSRSDTLILGFAWASYIENAIQALHKTMDLFETLFA